MSTEDRTPRRRPFLAPAIALLVAGALGLPPAPAQEAETPSAGAEQAEAPDERARSLRRILHLRGGGVLRKVTRFVDGHWEYKAQRWTALPDGAVASWELERDVLKQLKRREKELGAKRDAATRAELAGWMLEHGLLREAFSELDKVFDTQPGNDLALAVLERAPALDFPRLDVSAAEQKEARAELLTWAAGASPTGRELAIGELDRGVEREVLRDALCRELRQGSLRRRSFAGHALGRLFPGEELKNLLMHALLDPSEEARRYASYALRAPGEAAVLVPIIRGMNSSSATVRVNATEALGHVGHAAAVEPLMAHMAALQALQSSGTRSPVPHGHLFVGRQLAYIQDFDVEVAQFQAVADPQVNVLIEGDVLDAGVAHVGSYGIAYESKVVRTSLGMLTGENPGHTNKAWQSWWKGNAAKWQASELSRGASAPETPGR